MNDVEGPERRSTVTGNLLHANCQVRAKVKFGEGGEDGQVNADHFNRAGR
jgi:hypothetical protein